MTPRQDGKTAVFYPGTHALFNLYYDIRNDAQGEQSDLTLHYLAKCNGMATNQSYYAYKELDAKIDESGYGREVIDLFEIPELGTSSTDNSYYLFKRENIPERLEGDKISDVEVRSLNKEKIPESFIINKIYIDGNPSSGADVSFNIDKDGNVQNKQNIINSLSQKILYDTKSIEFRIDRELSDVELLLKTEKGNSIVLRYEGKQGEVIINSFEGLQEGKCSIKFRLLPSNSGLTKSNFETYTLMEKMFYLIKNWQEQRCLKQNLFYRIMMKILKITMRKRNFGLKF